MNFPPGNIGRKFFTKHSILSVALLIASSQRGIFLLCIKNRDIGIVFFRMFAHQLHTQANSQNGLLKIF